MGVKVYGPTLEDIEQGGKLIEQALKSSPSVIPSSVFYDRAVGAPSSRLSSTGSQWHATV